MLHAHCLRNWLMSTGVLFQSTFCLPCKFTICATLPMKGFNNLAVGTWYCYHCQYTSISRPCSGILTHHGYMWISTLNFAICVVLPLCFSLWNHLTTLMPFPPTPYIHWHNISAFLEMNHQKLAKLAIFCLPG